MPKVTIEAQQVQEGDYFHVPTLFHYMSEIVIKCETKEGVTTVITKPNEVLRREMKWPASDPVTVDRPIKEGLCQK